MKTIKNLVQASLVALTALWASSVQAAIEYRVSGDVGSDLKTAYFSIDGHSESGLAGAIRLTPTGSQGSAMVAVCTDVSAALNLGSTYKFQEVSFANAGTGMNPGWGSSSAYAAQALQNAAWIFDNYDDVLRTGTVSQKAAVQLAVWEVLYDTSAANSSLDFGQGRFKLNNGNDATTVSFAQSILAALPTSFTRYDGNLLIPNNGNVQELMGCVVRPDIIVTPVPEPSTVIAGALILIPFGISTFRIVRKNRV